MSSNPIVLFVDDCCNKPYHPYVLETEALGGTEATVIRIAEGLKATGLFQVFVEQHNRQTASDGYLPPQALDRADYVISLRSPATLVRSKERFPKAKHYLWNHDLCNVDTARALSTLSGFESVVVSQFHKSQMVETLKPQGYTGQFLTRVVYNPIDDNLQPDNTPVNPNKLVFFSSPHKGLDYALSVFENLRSFNSSFVLHVFNPGYLLDRSDLRSGVVLHGPQPHQECIRNLRDALCVFYPNTVFPETFGLVYAEANAVGTPVIAHSIGAAQEVLYHPAETLDCRNQRTVIDRVLAWYSGERPKVRANPKFRLKEVIRAWTRILNGR